MYCRFVLFCLSSFLSSCESASVLAKSGKIGFYSNSHVFSVVWAMCAEKPLISRFFERILNCQKQPTKAFKPILAHKTRNQVVAQAARGFESHPIRQQEPVISRLQALSFFLSGQFRALALFRREDHPFSPTPIEPPPACEVKSSDRISRALLGDSSTIRFSALRRNSRGSSCKMCK